MISNPIHRRTFNLGARSQVLLVDCSLWQEVMVGGSELAASLEPGVASYSLRWRKNARHSPDRYVARRGIGRLHCLAVNHHQRRGYLPAHC